MKFSKTFHPLNCHIMNLKIVVIFTFIVQVLAQSVYSCTTTKNEKGDCISLSSCYKLFKLIKPSLSAEELLLLKSRTCGIKNRKVQVCCLDNEKFAPLPTVQEVDGRNCKTRDGKEGHCRDIQNCYKLLKSTEPPVTSNMKSFLLSRKCEKIGSKVFVCCLADEINAPVVTEKTIAPLDTTIRPQTESLKISEKFPSPPRCGLDVSDRIFGGTATKIGEFPWLALLHYKNNEADEYLCGGSLINDRYVLTAGHCVTKIAEGWNLISVRLGEWDMSADPDCDDSGDEKICAPRYVEYRISEKTVHDDYNENSLSQHNDIALLRTAKKVIFTDYISPICLPFPNFFKNNNFSGHSMDVAGWGRTENMTASNMKLKVTLKAYPFNKCKSNYVSNKIILNEKQICAGGEEGKDSCGGDSGGPLMIVHGHENPAIFAVGIVSYGLAKCGIRNQPGVYTKVKEYLDWIENNTRK